MVSAEPIRGRGRPPMKQDLNRAGGPKPLRRTAGRSFSLATKQRRFQEVEGRCKAAAADARLAEYIASKYRPRRKERDIEEIKIADVLTIYLEDCGDLQARRGKLEERLGRLNEFWGAKTLAEISGETCRAYAAVRGSPGGARRDLEDLRAGHTAPCQGGTSPGHCG